MRSRTIIAAAAVPAAIAGTLLAGTAGAASASTLHPAAPPRVAVASVEVNGAGYEQYAQFEALQGFGSNRGYVDYTNFNYADPASHVWAPANVAEQLNFVYAGKTYPHTLNSGLVLKAVSPTEVKFTGTGEYPAGSSGTSVQDAWTIAGDVRGDVVTFTITYTSGNVGYVIHATGKIAPNGSAKGTATGTGGQALTWSLPAGSFQTVLHVVVPVKSDTINVKGQTVQLTWAFPAGQPFAGDAVAWTIHNGGRPAADTWKQVFLRSPLSETVEAGHIAIS